MAQMGVSTLHHHFRSLTAMSPLQYQKHLRLHVARERMLADGLDAASAAFEVGYESASQFNREYSRFFGQPPMRDIKSVARPSPPPQQTDVSATFRPDEQSEGSAFCSGRHARATGTER